MGLKVPSDIHTVIFRKTHSLPITDTGWGERLQQQCALHVQVGIPTQLPKPRVTCFPPGLFTPTQEAIRTGESSRTTTPGKGSGAGTEKASGLRSESAQAADPAEHPGRKGRAGAGGCSPRDAGAAAPPRTRTAATLAAREPRPCRQAAGADQPPCRVSRTKRAVETDTRSLSRRQTRRPRPSTWKNNRLLFPRRRPHKLEQTPPTSGSVRRLHAAQAQ